MKKHTRMTAMIALMSLLMLVLSGCSSAQNDVAAAEEPAVLTAVPTAAPTVEANPEGVSGTVDVARKQDGERFESMIMLEGMEETVRYEHVRNDALGIEMDFDYESFVRRSGPASECFISCYDNADQPENYLELIRTEEDAGSASASIAESLSQQFDVHQDSRTLEKAGTCTVIDASATKDGKTPDRMQAVFVIPLSKGCVIATMHYGFEAADGFGKRCSAMLNTREILDSGI
jgi:hypothetical protein